jgi:hypothetical protein
LKLQTSPYSLSIFGYVAERCRRLKCCPKSAVLGVRLLPEISEGVSLERLKLIVTVRWGATVDSARWCAAAGSTCTVQVAAAFDHLENDLRSKLHISRTFCDHFEYQGDCGTIRLDSAVSTREIDLRC